MPIKRVFLGWSSPCLTAAVSWLGRYSRDGTWDLSNGLIAVPGARAGRRLLELLVEQSQTSRLTLVPPLIVTAGELAGRLFAPSKTLASPMQVLAARVQSIQAAPRELLEGIMAHPPDPSDLAACLRLAEQLTQLQQTLAGGIVRIQQVNQRVAAFGGRLELQAEEEDPSPDPSRPSPRGRGVELESQRWQVLAQLQQAYEQRLADQDLADPHLEAIEAVESSRCQTGHDVVLLATCDLNRLTRQIIERLDAKVFALIHAPPDEANGFDACGCLNSSYWAERPLNLDERAVHIVDRPRDQALAVLECLSALREAPDHDELPYGADEITIGLGQEQYAALVQRTLETAGLGSRSATTTTVGQSRPALLLHALGRFVDTNRTEDLAALLRHPDFEACLVPELRLTPRDQDTASKTTDWLSLVDRYVSDHLQPRLDDESLPDQDSAARLTGLGQTIRAMMPSASQRRPLAVWSEPLGALLTNVYGGRPLQAVDPSDHQIIRSLKAFALALSELAQLDADAAPAVTAAEAIDWLLRRVGDLPVPQDGPTPAIELLGWLELQLDDAPVLIATGLNEHSVPRSRNSDPFLPDSVRRRLGITHNRQRYARDLYLLTAICQSRPHVQLICGRRDHENNPLIPSRLLLACDDELLPKRAAAYFDEAAYAPLGPPTILLDHGPSSRFLIPPPDQPMQPIQQLAATAFRDYIACPYRFYLKHVLKLRELDDRAVEMDGGTFGSLAHDVLAAFGTSELSSSTDAKAIAKFLYAQLSREVRRQFGPRPSAAVLVQCEQLRSRLQAFSEWQAEQPKLGWKIITRLTESRHEAVLEVDGEPFSIFGRIDRIDEHPTQGHRLVDYKTSDRAETPETKHRSAQGEWIDLQLPLYRRLAASAGVAGEIQLGFLLLPKDLGRVRFEPASWSERDLKQATQQAFQIIRDIRAGRFWPPQQPPSYDDGLTAICMDHSTRRQEAIEATSELLAARQGA